jgi:hypothetical protein
VSAPSEDDFDHEALDEPISRRHARRWIAGLVAALGLVAGLAGLAFWMRAGMPLGTADRPISNEPPVTTSERALTSHAAEGTPGAGEPGPAAASPEQPAAVPTVAPEPAPLENLPQRMSPTAPVAAQPPPTEDVREHARTPAAESERGLGETSRQQMPREASVAPAAREPRQEPQPPATGARALPQRSSAGRPRRVAREAPAFEAPPSSPPPSPRASPSPVTAAARRGDVRVDISAERLQAGVTAYTVRLRERTGAPVKGASVSIRGRRADGVLVAAVLDPTPEPGVYRAAVRIADVTDARLRVARAGLIQDEPLPD